MSVLDARQPRLMKCNDTMPYHDSPRKNQFIGAVLSGVSVPQAARDNSIPQSTAYSLWHKYKTTGSTDALPRSGRPPKVTPRLARRLVLETKKHRQKPLRDVGRAVVPKVSTSTVRRVLAKEGRHQRKARKVVYLTETHQKARLAWAKQFRSMRKEDWRRVIWSDECYVYVGDDRGTMWITRAADEVYNEDCHAPTFKQSPLRVMIWGSIVEG